MKEQQTNMTANAAKKRLEVFLDCLSRLLATRWLREQQSEEQVPRAVTDEDAVEENA